MSYSTYCWSVVAALLATSFLPAAEAQCTYTEIVGVKETSIGAATCSSQSSYTYSGDGVLGGPTCRHVPEVRVAGTTVPGTGKDYCTPDQDVSFESGQSNATYVMICADQTPPGCSPSVLVVQPVCLAYSVLWNINRAFRCYTPPG